MAANPIPATTGALIRTLMNAARNPVSASIPILPSELYPCTANVPPAASVKKNPTITTVPPIIANVPAPMLISAINRMISFRKCNAACGVPAIARP